MPQKDVKIRDALKTEYADFVDFCISLDKQFISELTTSDFIAFRTQHNATRDYIANIRHMLYSFDPEARTQHENTKVDLPIDEASIIDQPGNEAFISEDVESEKIPETAEDDEPTKCVISAKKETAIEDVQAPKEPSEESNAVINETDARPISEVAVYPSKTFSSTKPWLNYLEELRFLDIELPLYNLFNITYDPIYASKNIAELGMSVRPYNCLIKNNCQTVDALFSKSLREVSELAHLGKKSLFEIIDKCKQIAANPQSIIKVTSSETVASAPSAAESNENLIRLAESIALGIQYDTSDLSETEKKFVVLLENAYESLGEEMCLLALEEPSKTRHLCSVLNNYVKQQEILKQLALAVSQVGNSGIVKELHVLPFITALKKKTAIDLSMVFTENDCFTDVAKAVEKYLENKSEESVALTDSLHVFADDIASGISKELEEAYENAITTDRVSVVVQLRQEGYSLAEIGDLLDITRERVRQIEAGAIRRFSSSLRHADKNVISYIHAMLDGDLMIQKEQIAACVANRNHLDLLWESIESGALDTKEYRYVKQYNAIVFRHEDSGAAAKIVSSLPSYIFKDELEEIILHAVEEKGVWEEKLRADIKQHYKVFGTLYSVRRPTVVFICDWILRNRFVNGFKINDATDTKRFQEYAREVFGETSCHMTQRALDAKISAVGVLCDRGKYIHPSMVTLDESILNEVNQYIAESPKNAITYIELFEAFRDRLAGTQISNHYFLQGVMKQFGSAINRRVDYYLYRDYITKDANVSPTDELDAFVRERGMVHKTEIFAEFPALNELSLGQVVARCQNVFNIDSGFYIHSSQFHIQETDYAPIRTYLTEATRDLPVNIRKVFDDCSVQFPEFMDRNEIHNRDVLFAVLSYMFMCDFRFNRPYIANSDDIEMTNRGVILSVLEPFDEIAIDELMNLLDERGIHYGSLSYLMQLIAPDYVRSDENLMMKRSLTGIDDDVEEEALTILSEAVETYSYLPSCKVLDFIWYPSIDITWTPYLLESIVLSSNRLDYVSYPFSRSHRSLVVYVSKKYANCDFQTMLLQIIDEEYSKGTFTRKAEMREWLIETGFIDGKLPSFLESAQYYYMDDNGRLLRREDSEQ